MPTSCSALEIKLATQSPTIHVERERKIEEGQELTSRPVSDANRIIDLNARGQHMT